MADPNQEIAPRPRRAFKALVGVLVFFGLICVGVWQAIVHPDTPLPPHWNPSKPLVIDEPITWVTPGKLQWALRDPQVCLETLDGFVQASQLDPLEDTPQCHIRTRMELAGLSKASIGPVETSCAIALRMAMWERHVVQPAAARLMFTEVTEIKQIGSYNCRPIRTPEGDGATMSTHATASAIDITGFDMADGRRIRLQDHWGSVEFGPFLRAVRDGACDYFAATLGPDFNALHADHFHLQSQGRGACK